MMKNFLLPILFSIFYTSIKAQLLVGPAITSGASWISFHEKESRGFYKQTPVLTYQAGFDVSFQIRKDFYLHSAILYSRKGKSLRADIAPELKEIEIDHYLDMPIIFAREFKIKVNRNKLFKIYFGMGPNVSYWLNGKGSLTTAQLLEDQVHSLNYKIIFNKDDMKSEGTVFIPEANRWQLGLNLNTGFVFEPWGFQKFYLSFRYSIGHTYIAKSGLITFPGVFDYSSDLKARNMGFGISLSYLIDLKPTESKRGKSTLRI